MTVNIIDPAGETKNSIDLNDTVFNVDISTGSVYHKIRNELANKRQGTAKTKGRSEVRYSGRKPWRQKGTGRARAGTRRSPIWRGGGTTFGPIPRDYSYVLPDKIKQLAFKSVYTAKLQEQKLEIVADFKVESLKTKDCSAILKALHPEQKKTILIVTDEHADIKRSARNIPWVRVYSYNRLLLKDLFYTNKILVLVSAAEKINTFYRGRIETQAEGAAQ